ncbi:MAG: hypothetical protein ACKVQU_25115 [Burkholderiales bacterium]
MLGKIIVRLMGLLTRQGLLIEEQGVRYRAGIGADQRSELEQLCRTITRPAASS